jgi:hypothetical protein
MTTLHDLYEDPVNFTKVSSADLFAIDYDEVIKLQLHHFKRRFQQLRPKIRALDRLAEDVEIDEIRDFDDLATLAFPHTMYKSYAVSDVDEGRYDRMTQWLQSFTAHNLSNVNVEGCVSLDDWMDRLEAQTPLRPALSSGTSGKISVWPRSTVEEPFFLEHIYRMFDPYKDEPTIDLRSGRYPYLCAWPAAYGRHNYPIMFRLLRENAYKQDPNLVITLGQDFMGAGELWLAGKLRRAEARGEKVVLTPREEKLVERMKAAAKNNKALWDSFIDRAVLQQRGKRVLFFGYWTQNYQIAKECSDRGIKIEWAPDSIVFTGGGTKGFTFPEGWMDVINSTFPFTYPNQFREGYGMSETTAVAMMCRHGVMHPLPWGIQHLSDPETGKPLPRSGVQRGRMLVLDLLPSTYWPGTATGDEVTIDWDARCECGRKGPVIHNSIERLIDRRGGDDKITCAKTPEAYERLEEFVVSS